MKNVSNLYKRFIDECNNKIKSKKIMPKSIVKATGLSDSTIKDFLKGKSDAKIKTVIKIINAMNSELRIK